jgi:hypothetical protein
MKSTEFDRKKHLYKSEAFVELVKDAVRFFNGTPVHILPPAEAFLGTGVYALYYNSWQQHLDELRGVSHLSFSGTKYNVQFKLINAANHGVPQNRDRVIIVGIRSDLDCESKLI